MGTAVAVCCTAVKLFPSLLYNTTLQTEAIYPQVNLHPNVLKTTRVHGQRVLRSAYLRFVCLSDLMPNRYKSGPPTLNDFMPFQFYAGFFRGTLPGIKSGPLLYTHLVFTSDSKRPE